MQARGKNAFDPFHFALKSPDINTSIDPSQLPDALDLWYNYSLRHKGFSDPRTTARIPLKLQLSAPTHSIR